MKNTAFLHGSGFMQIKGYNKTTLLDYPEHVAATVFTGGCNFRCPFCHNADLVLNPDGQAGIGEEEVLAHLQKRKGFLEGVCITGGEPALQPDLPEFIGKIKELGYLVKLDTNGYSPKVLERLLGEGLLDYVAMDIKASKKNYARAAGQPQLDLGKIEESMEMLKSGKIPYEFRTTVVKGIHSIEEFDAIGGWLAGSRAYYLQAFRDSENVLAQRFPEILENVGCEQGDGGVCEGSPVYAEKLSEFTKNKMEQMAEIARKYIDKVELRGVE